MTKIRPIFEEELPQILQCDNEFRSYLFTSLCEDTETQLIFSSSYKPNTNGLVERFNKTFKELLHRLMTQRNSKNWPSLVPEVMEIYNNTYHSTLKDTPNYYWENNMSSGSQQKIINEKVLKKAREPAKFKVGDKVRRVMKKKDPNKKMAKSFIAQYTTSIYEVVSVLNSSIPSYKIKNDEDEILAPIFHNWDLLLTK
jgi:hypothetical protein